VKILLVEFTSAVSGGERSLLELIQGLRREHDLNLACPHGPLANLAAAFGVRVLPIPASQLTFRIHPRHTPRGLAGMARAAGRLHSIVRSVSPGVVHANSIRAGLLAIPAARGVSPVVVHCRDALPKGIVGAAVRTAILTGAEGVVAISAHVAKNLAGEDWAHRRVTVVDNAVDLERFDPALLPRSASRRALDIEADLVVSVIAQITPWKGQDLAIRVLAELRRRGHEALLLLVGDAKFVTPATRYDNRAFDSELRVLVESMNLQGHVRFLGERSDAERILAATDVLLVPSIEEPFGRTIIEAMAMCIPVAATNIGGPPEILRNQIGGRIVRGRDAAAWADTVEELAGWPPDRRAAARATARSRFSRDRHATTMLAVYAGARAQYRSRSLLRASS